MPQAVNVSQGLGIKVWDFVVALPKLCPSGKFCNQSPNPGPPRLTAPVMDRESFASVLVPNTKSGLRKAPLPIQELVGPAIPKLEKQAGVIPRGSPELCLFSHLSDGCS